MRKKVINFYAMSTKLVALNQVLLIPVLKKLNTIYTRHLFNIF